MNTSVASLAPTAATTRSARIRRILLPTDFSDASRQALLPAVALARQFEAALTLLYVVPTTLPAEFSHLGLTLETHRLASEAERILAEFRARELPHDLTVQTLVKDGGAAFQINETAQAMEADLIVLSTHGYTGLRHAWLGSTAERVVRHAPCPVLVIRANPLPLRFPQDGDTLAHFKHILIPTDFSPASDKAMIYAAALGTRDDATYRMLHVIEPPPYPEFGYAHVPAREAELRGEALERLEVEGQRMLGGTLMKRTEKRVRAGRASFEIAAEARDAGCDLIVAGTHGRSALKTLFLGSTAEEMIRHATVPVLIVREREHDFV